MFKKILLCSSFILVALSAIAQVKMYYPEYMTGAIQLSDVSAVSVTNFTPVTIEYIYKAKVVDEQGVELLRMTSGVVACKRGGTDYAEEEIKGLQVLKKEIDFSNYSGRLTLYSRIVHPVDTSSIIAVAEKTLLLKNGVSMDEDEKPLTDPNLFRMEFTFPYNEKFNIKDLFSYVLFKNDNYGAYCVDFSFVITQGEKEIYKAGLEGICVAPGKSTLTQLQQEQAKLTLDEYATRLPMLPIQVELRKGEKYAGKRTVDPAFHSDQGEEYTRYFNLSTGLSFEYLENAGSSSLPIASNTIVIFDENGKVSAVEQHPFERMKSNPLGIDGPDGCTRRRADVNGTVYVQVLSKDSFTPEQWMAYVAFVNGIDEKELKIIRSNDLEIIAPSNRSNERKNAGSTLTSNIYFLAIKDKDKVILFQAGYLAKVLVATDTNAPKVKIDIEKILNSINYNNLDFKFEFNDAGELEQLTLSPMGSPIDPAARQLKYDKFLKYQWVMNNHLEQYGIDAYDENQAVNYAALDAHVATYGIKEQAALPKYKVITPAIDSFRKYETFQWDSMQVSFSHRVDGTRFAPFTSSRPEDYFYQNKDKIEDWSQAPGKDPNAMLLEKHGQHLRIFPLTLQIHPVFGQNIGIARMELPVDEALLKSIVAYENVGHFSAAPPIKTIQTNGWKIYISELMVNSGRYTQTRNLLFIDSGAYLYRIKISGGFKSDIPHLLNSLKIEGKQFRFKYNQEQRLEGVEVI